MAEKINSTSGKRPGFLRKIGTFFREAKSELAKVVWPTPKQTLDSTVTVLVIALIAGVFIGVIDWLFKTGVSMLIG